MLVLIGSYFVSLIPAVIIYLWFRNYMHRHDQAYKLFCRDSLVKGIGSVLLVIVLSASLSLLGNMVLFKERSGLLYAAYRTFIVLALAEETAKFVTFRRLLKKTETSYSALDMIASMTLVGLGFEIIESVVYAVTTNPMQMLVRGITAMHAGYGFVMGYFYARSRLTGNRFYAIIGFVLPALLHGAYDFGLSDAFAATSENYAFLSVNLAILALILLIIMFLFTRKARRNPMYTELIGQGTGKSEE